MGCLEFTLDLVGEVNEVLMVAALCLLEELNDSEQALVV